MGSGDIEWVCPCSNNSCEKICSIGQMLKARPFHIDTQNLCVKEIGRLNWFIES